MSNSGAIVSVVDETAQINVKDAPFGAKGDGVTDDTAAIQAAIVAAANLSNPHVQVVFPDASGEEYMVKGALQTVDPITAGGRYYSQICIPLLSDTAGHNRKILELVGLGDRGIGPGGADPAPGPRLTSTLTAQAIGGPGGVSTPAMIAGQDPSVVGFTNVFLKIKGLMFRAPSLPTIVGVMGMNIASMEVEESSADTTDGSSLAPSNPGVAAAWSCAFAFPRVGNHAFCSARDVFVMGYTTAFAFHEHFRGDELFAFGCTVAFGLESDELISGHSASFGHVGVEGCRVVFGGYDTIGRDPLHGPFAILCQYADVEDFTAGWNTVFFHIADANDVFVGTMVGTRTTAGSGPNAAAFTKNGGTGITATNVL